MPTDEPAADPASPDDPPPSNHLERVSRYRRLGVASLLLGVVALAVASRFDHVVLGVGAYWLGFAGFLWTCKGTDVQLFDERDRQLEQRAAAHALTALGLLLVVTWPAAIALQSAGHVQLPRAFVGAVYGYVLLFGLFGAVYVALRYRP